MKMDVRDVMNGEVESISMSNALGRICGENYFKDGLPIILKGEEICEQHLQILGLDMVIRAVKRSLE